MLPGFNTNIRHREMLFHVQTEDSGQARPRIVTLLYHGGTILSSTTCDYADRLEAPDLERQVRKLMEGQHKTMLLDLRHGAFDGVIEERILSPAAGGAAVPEASPASATSPAPKTAQVVPVETPLAAKPPPPDPADAAADDQILAYLMKKARKRSAS